MKKTTRRTFGAATFLLSLLFWGQALAADFRAPEADGDGTVTVGAGETVKNLYVAGPTVTVNAPAQGDLFVAGGAVSVIGSTEQDLFVAGGNVQLSGSVGGDLRAAAGNLTVGGSVGGDLLAAGGTVTVPSGSRIAGDAVLGGGTVTLEAPVSGRLTVGGESVTINGRVDGAVRVVAERLVFGPNADIRGSVQYRGRVPAVVKAGANVPEISFTELPRRSGALGALTAAFVLKVLAWTLVGLILVRYRKDALRAVYVTATTSPWVSLGVGLVAAVATPVVAFVLLLSGVGYYLGLLLLAGYAAALLLAGVAAALCVGAKVVSWLQRQAEPRFDWQTVLIGVVVWQLLRFIPFLGWLLVALCYLAVLGALLSYVRERAAHSN